MQPLLLSPDALNPNSRQMQFVSLCTKVIDDLLFVHAERFEYTSRNTTYRCIHIPSLVGSTRLPDGSVSLTRNVFRPECILELTAVGSISTLQTIIYSIPACPPTRPRYCFIIKRAPEGAWRVDWEVLEVEIDLRIPGPVKIFSSVSRQYRRQVSTYPLHDNDNDLQLYLPLGRESQPNASLSVRFLRVGKPDDVRVARLGGVDQMQLSGLSVDRDAGYVIIWAQWNGGYSFIWWLDERQPGNMVSQTKELISSWSRGLLSRV